jgi:hypothetical protein
MLRWLVPLGAAAWSLGLVVCGMWAILDAATQWPIFFVPLVAGGVCLLAGGHVVFLACVADRLFPNARLAVVEWLEIASCLMFMVGLSVCLAALACL